MDKLSVATRDFDSPVIMTRFDLVEVPDFEVAVFTGDLDPYRPSGKHGRDD